MFGNCTADPAKQKHARSDEQDDCPRFVAHVDFRKGRHRSRSCVEAKKTNLPAIMVEIRNVARKIAGLIPWYRAALPICIEDEGKTFAEEIGRQSLKANAVVCYRRG